MKMQPLDSIAEDVRRTLEAKNSAREAALSASRTLVRNSANAIRAVHRGEFDLADRLLSEAGDIVRTTEQALHTYPDLYWTGYVQDAQKEYCEARLVYAIVHDDPLPGPAEIGVELSPYLNGLGEAAGELRRYALDLIRRHEMERAEVVLNVMEDIYGLLVTVDYPDALTGGLRRTTDMVRGVLERTRGDLTISMRQNDLEQALGHLESVVRHDVLGEEGDQGVDELV